MRYEILLIHRTLDILHAVCLVDIALELVCMPREVDVQRWYEERARCGAHQIQETRVSHTQFFKLWCGPCKCSRVVTSDAVHQDDLSFRTAEGSRFLPTRTGASCRRTSPVATQPRQALPRRVCHPHTHCGHRRPGMSALICSHCRRPCISARGFIIGRRMQSSAYHLTDVRVLAMQRYVLCGVRTHIGSSIYACQTMMTSRGGSSRSTHSDPDDSGFMTRSQLTNLSRVSSASTSKGTNM